VRLLPTKRTVYLKAGDKVGGWTINAINIENESVEATDQKGEQRIVSRAK